MASDSKTKHYSEGKAGVDQIPPEFLMELGRVYSYGQTKYGRDNWKSGTAWHEFYASLLRHVFKFWLGEDYDNCPDDCPDQASDICSNHSRRHHLAQVAWNAATLYYYQMHDLGEDTR